MPESTIAQLIDNPSPALTNSVWSRQGTNDYETTFSQILALLTGGDIRDRLALLSGNDRLDASAIKNLSASLTTEDIQDATAPLLVNGVHTGLSASYDDANNRINLIVDSEWAQDVIAPLLNHANHTNITATYNDTANRIELVGSSGGGGGSITWNTTSLSMNTLAHVLGYIGNLNIVSGVTQLTISSNSEWTYFLNSPIQTNGFDLRHFAIKAEIFVNSTNIITADKFYIGLSGAVGTSDVVSTSTSPGGFGNGSSPKVLVTLFVFNSTELTVQFSAQDGSVPTTNYIFDKLQPRLAMNTWVEIKLIVINSLCSIYINGVLRYRGFLPPMFHRVDGSRAIHPMFGGTASSTGTNRTSSFRNISVSYGSVAETLPF